MRIDDQIRNNTFPSEWKILLTIEHPNGTLLTVTTSKLITNLRNSLRSHFNFGKAKALFIDCQYDLINFPSFRVLQASRAVLARFSQQLIHFIISLEISKVSLSNSGGLTYDDIISAYLIAWVYESIKVKLIVAAVPSPCTLSEIRHLKLLIFILGV